MKRKDIRDYSEEDKFAEYDKIGVDTQGVHTVEGACFPDVLVDHKKTHLLTDVFSLEKWFRLRRTKAS